MEGLKLSVGSILQKYDRQVWVFFFIQMVTLVGAAVVIPFFSLYLRSAGISESRVGMILTVAFSCSALAVIAGGTLSDRFGRKPLLAFSLGTAVIVFAASAYLIGRGASFLIVSALILIGIPVGHLVRSMSNTVISDVGAGIRRTNAFGILYIGLNIGFALGNAIGGNLANISYSCLFALPAVTYLLSLILTMSLVTGPAKYTAPQPLSSTKLMTIKNDPPFLAFCAISLVSYLMMAQFNTTLAIFSVEHVGISKPQLGYLYVVNGLYIVFLQYPIVVLIRRMKLSFSLALSMLIYSIGYLSVGFDRSFITLAASVIAITTGEIIFVPSSLSVVANLSPWQSRGQYMGFFISLQLFGWAFGPLIGGVLLSSFHGSPIAIWGTISLIGVLAMVGHIVFGHTVSVNRSPEASTEIPI